MPRPYITPPSDQSMEMASFSLSSVQDITKDEGKKDSQAQKFLSYDPETDRIDLDPSAHQYIFPAGMHTPGQTALDHFLTYYGDDLAQPGARRGFRARQDTATITALHLGLAHNASAFRPAVPHQHTNSHLFPVLAALPGHVEMRALRQRADLAAATQRREAVMATNSEEDDVRRLNIKAAWETVELKEAEASKARSQAKRKRTTAVSKDVGKAVPVDSPAARTRSATKRVQARKSVTFETSFSPEPETAEVALMPWAARRAYEWRNRKVAAEEAMAGTILAPLRSMLRYAEGDDWLSKPSANGTVAPLSSGSNGIAAVGIKRLPRRSMALSGDQIEDQPETNATSRASVVRRTIGVEELLERDV